MMFPDNDAVKPVENDELDDRLGPLLESYLDDLASCEGDGLNPDTRIAHPPFDSDLQDIGVELCDCIKRLNQLRQDAVRLGSDPEIDVSLDLDFSIPSETTRLHSPDFNSPPNPGERIVPPVVFRTRNYEVLRELGRGGHGVVYLAFDLVIRRHVAIKFPVPEILIDFRGLERFFLEARAAGSLNHPNIVRILDVGEREEVPFIVSEYVSGPSLANWLAGQGMSVSAMSAARLVADLASAIAHAHSQGVVHRDIKPGNVLLQRKMDTNGEPDELPLIPRLTDFGVARVESSRGLTRTGDVLGTPAYLSPEQAQGRTNDIGPRSDLFSLGSLLYLLLTGRAAFQGENDLEILGKVSQSQFQPPRRIKPNIPKEIEAICLKCMQLDPADRYATADEVCEDLHRYLEGRPVLARRQSALPVLMKLSRRYPLTVGVSAAAVFLLATLLGVTLWYNARLEYSLKDIHRQKQLAESKEFSLRRRVYSDDLKIAAGALRHGDCEYARRCLVTYLPENMSPDLRTFPWWLLWKRSQETTTQLGRLPPGLSAVAVDSTGTLGAAGSSDGVIRLWNLSKRTYEGELRGHTMGDINSLEFAPSGPGFRLLSASADGTARLWNLENRTASLALPARKGWLAAACFLGPTGETVASAGENKTIQIWDTRSGKLLREWDAHTDTIRDLSAHPRDFSLASSAEDGTVRLWDWRSGKPDPRFPGGLIDRSPETYCRSIEFSPDGKALAVGFSGDGTLRLWNTSETNYGKMIGTAVIDTRIRKLSWRDDGSLIAASGNVILLGRNVIRGDFRWETLCGHSDRVMCMSEIPKSGGLLSLGRQGDLRQWSKSMVDGNFLVHSHPDAIPAAPQWGERFFTVVTEGLEVFGYSLPEFRPAFHFTLSGTRRNWFITSADGKTYYTSLSEGDNYTLAAIDTATGLPGWKINLGKEPARHGDFFAGGRSLAICVGHEIWVLDLHGRIHRKLLHPRGVKQVLFLTSGSQLITACDDGQIRIWDSVTGDLQKTLHAQKEAATVLAISLDGRRLATAGNDNRVLVWDIDQSSLIATFSVGEPAVALSFLDDGETLAVIHADNSKIRFWSIPDRVQLTQWNGFPYPTQSLQFSPDRKSIAFLSGGRIRLIDVLP